MNALLDPNVAVSDAALAAHVRAAVQAFRGALGTPLCATLDAFAAERDLDFDAAPLRNFTRTAQPVAHLPVWTARALLARGKGLLPEGALEGALDAALFGYLCAQVQDDGLEGRLGPPAAWTLLAHAAFARHQAALVAAAGTSPSFWLRYSERWLGYAGAVATFAGDGPAPGSERLAARERSRPLVLPAAALLVAAGEASLVEPLETLIQGSTDAAQLYDDLFDAPEDLRQGRATYVVRAMDGARGLDTLRRRLYLEGGFDRVLGQALDGLARARDAAAELGMTHAVAAFAADAETMAGARRRYLDALESLIFADARGPAER